MQLHRVLNGLGNAWELEIGEWIVVIPASELGLANVIDDPLPMTKPLRIIVSLQAPLRR